VSVFTTSVETSSGLGTYVADPGACASIQLKHTPALLLASQASVACTFMRPAELGATRLFVLRHGRSLANEKAIIVSRLDNGLLADYALAPEGVEQAAEAGKALLAWLSANGFAPTDVCIVASPFSRTVQTAKTAAAQLGLDANAVRTDDALRERFFGDELELRDHRCAVSAANAGCPQFALLAWRLRR